MNEIYLFLSNASIKGMTVTSWKCKYSNVIKWEAASHSSNGEYSIACVDADIPNGDVAAANGAPTFSINVPISALNVKTIYTGDVITFSGITMGGAEINGPSGKANYFMPLKATSASVEPSKY